MTGDALRPAPDLPRHPFDDDKLREECGVMMLRARPRGVLRRARRRIC